MKRFRRDKEQPSLLQRFLAWDWCLLTCCFIGVAIGFAVGFALYVHKVSSDVIMWVGLPGELYMRMLKAVVLPLIISSIITGTAGLKPKENGKVGAVSLGYIIITNVIGGLIGLLFALIIKPGETEDSVSDANALDTGHLQTSDLFADLIRNLVPDNVVSACFEKSQTRYKTVTVELPLEGNITSNITNTSTTEVYQRYLGKAGGTNILGLVIACTVVGMAAAQTGESARPFVNFFSAASDVLLLLVQWLVMFTPIGAASLIASAVGKSTNIEATFRGLGLFVLAEILGNVAILIGVLPLAYFIIVRRNPFAWMLNASRAAMTAMVTTSSAVAMPQHLENMENRHGVDKRVTSLVIPLAVAINRDGSTMFIALTSVYMAQLQGATAADTMLLITILAAVGSLAVPATASSSIVTVLMIVDSLGVSPANIGILLALEWFSDRFRTMVNNYSHPLCCLITWHLCQASVQQNPGSPEEGGCHGDKPFTPGSTDLSPNSTSTSADEESSASPLLGRKAHNDIVAMDKQILGEMIPMQSSGVMGADVQM